MPAAYDPLCVQVAGGDHSTPTLFPSSATSVAFNVDPTPQYHLNRTKRDIAVTAPGENMATEVTSHQQLFYPIDDNSMSFQRRLPDGSSTGRSSVGYISQQAVGMISSSNIPQGYMYQQPTYATASITPVANTMVAAQVQGHHPPSGPRPAGTAIEYCPAIVEQYVARATLLASGEAFSTGEGGFRPQPAPGTSDPQNTTVFVGGLTHLLNETVLKAIFSPFGPIISAKIPPGKSCGFIQYADKINAERAIACMQGFDIYGHPVRLSWGRSQKDKQAIQQSQQFQYSRQHQQHMQLCNDVTDILQNNPENINYNHVVALVDALKSTLNNQTEQISSSAQNRNGFEAKTERDSSSDLGYQQQLLAKFSLLRTSGHPAAPSRTINPHAVPFNPSPGSNNYLSAIPGAGGLGTYNHFSSAMLNETQRPTSDLSTYERGARLWQSASAQEFSANVFTPDSPPFAPRSGNGLVPELEDSLKQVISNDSSEDGKTRTHSTESNDSIPLLSSSTRTSSAPNASPTSLNDPNERDPIVHLPTLARENYIGLDFFVPPQDELENHSASRRAYGSLPSKASWPPWIDNRQRASSTSEGLASSNDLDSKLQKWTQLTPLVTTQSSVSAQPTLATRFNPFAGNGITPIITSAKPTNSKTMTPL